MLNSIPKKVFTWATFALMLLALLGKGHLSLQIGCLIASLLCLYLTEEPGRWTAKQKREEVAVIIIFLYGVLLVLIYIGYQDEKDTKNFRRYLTEHRCKYIGTIVTGYSPGGCDNIGRCTDGEEIEEGQYLCRATGNKLTFKQFQEGSYGH